MRKIMAISALLVSFGATNALPAESVDQIKRNCAAEWSNDYVMQKYCVDQQMAAAVKLKNLLRRYPKGTVGYDIAGRCAVEWPGKIAGYDFQIIVYCTEQQIEAYNALRQ